MRHDGLTTAHPGYDVTVSNDTCDALVMFGATGDLAASKLFGALYDLAADGQGFDPIVGVGRTEWSDDELRERVATAVRRTRHEVDDDVLDGLLAAMRYVTGGTDDERTYATILDAVGPCRRPLVYLGLPPALFADAAAGIVRAGVDEDVRVLVEKPYGADRESAEQLTADLHEHLDESQIFRIDHFMTKDAVQNVLLLRFANRVFAPVWNAEHVESVRVVMSEADAVGDRASFYDGVGAMRDVVQNHLLQLVATVAMDEPDPDVDEPLREARLRLLRSIGPFEPSHVTLAQYTGYRDHDGIDPESTTDTFVRARFEIDSDRWRGVPWSLETGKALGETSTFVELTLLPMPSAELLGADPEHDRNRIVLSLKPDVSVRLELVGRGAGVCLETARVEMVAEPDPDVGSDAYARLFALARLGDRTSFASLEEVLAAWEVVGPALRATERLPFYAPGTPIEQVAAAHADRGR